MKPSALLVMVACACGASSKQAPQEPQNPSASSTLYAHSPGDSKEPRSEPSSSTDRALQEAAAHSADYHAASPPMSAEPTPTVSPGKNQLPETSTRSTTTMDVGGPAAALQGSKQGVVQRAISQDALEAPLLDRRRYEGCGLSPQVRLTLKVVVLDGNAASADVTSKPRSPALEQCVERAIRAMVWEKVRTVSRVTVRL